MVITVPNVRSFIFVSSQASVVDEWIDAIYSIFVHPATSPLPASQPMLSTPNSLGVTRQSVNSSNGERRFAPPVSMGRGNNTGMLLRGATRCDVLGIACH